jgi:catechol 2,3-dioxygenase-like lactoylglutathione lyase family enzyme
MDEEVVPILRVASAATAVAWYERLGFIKEWEFRFDPDCPAFVSVTRGRVRLFLSEHRGDARPDTLVGLSVKDIDAVVAEFGRPEGEPPYGCEFELRDPDGNLLRITAVRAT